MTKICTDPSGLPDLRWVAKLSDGKTVWQDDRDGGNSWRSLKAYVEENGLGVTALQMEFRSHIIDVPKAAAYYFNKGVRASFGGSQECFVIGYGSDYDLKQGIVKVYFYSTPELEVASADVRLIDDEVTQRNLIYASGQSNREVKVSV